MCRFFPTVKECSKNPLRPEDQPNLTSGRVFFSFPATYWKQALLLSLQKERIKEKNSLYNTEQQKELLPRIPRGVGEEKTVFSPLFTELDSYCWMLQYDKEGIEEYCGHVRTTSLYYM